MRVAVIAPPYPLEEGPAPPLGVCYVAAAFEAAGAEVRIFDYVVSRSGPEKLRDQLDAFRPHVVGATSVTMNFSAAADLVSQVKAYAPYVVTLMGGPHVSFAARQTLEQYPGIDCIVMGEGEATIADLYPRIHDPDSWDEVPGITFRAAGRITTTQARAPIEDLDSLPMPARHLLCLSRYQALGYPVSIITSRGCPNRCIFCQGRRMVGSRVRLRSCRSVVDEMESLVGMGFTRINIADDLFTSRKQRVLEVCDLMRRRGLSLAWTAFSRVNTVDGEMLRAMRAAGCDCISFGIESGNAEMLQRIRKGITLEQARRAVALCKEAGILAHASFMVGLPGETPETLEQTDRFAKSLGILYGYHFLAPFPGTTVREEIEDFDLQILTSDWSLYDANRPVVRTSRLSPEQMARFVADFEKGHHEEMKRLEAGYVQGTNTPQENLVVEGTRRTALLYRILSEDLIEGCGARDGASSVPEALDRLSRHIADTAGVDRQFTSRTLAAVYGAGHIEYREGAGGWRWRQFTLER